MSHLAQLANALRTHGRLVAATSIALVLLGGGAGLAVATNRPVETKSIAAHQMQGHTAVPGPSLEDTSDYSPYTAATPAPTTVPAGGGSAGVVTTTPPATRPSAATNGVAGTSVSKTQVASGTGSDGFSVPKENPANLTAVTTPLPTSIVLPAGAVQSAPTLKYPNGVVEWAYLVKAATHDDVVKAMRAALSSNGWAVSSESDGAPIAMPDGSTLRMKRFYVSSATQRGLVNVNGPTAGDVTIQIDLVAR